MVVMAATAFRAALPDQVGANLPFVTYYPAIIFAAYYGQILGGTIALMLASTLTWFVFLPGGQPPSPTAIALFVLSTSVIVVMIGSMSAVMHRLQRAENDLKSAKDNFRALVDTNPQIAWLANPTGEIVDYSSHLLDIIDSKIDLLSAQKWFGVIHPDDAGRVFDLWTHSIQTKLPFDVEHRMLTKIGYRWSRSRAYPQFGDGGLVMGWFGIIEDIQERKVIEHSREILLAEIDHRARNLLAVVHGIIKLTAATTDSKLLVPIVIGRVHALGVAHSLLADSQWTGVRIADIVGRELSIYGNRIHICKDEMILKAEAVQPIAVIIHELATNSYKFGALSGEGTVDISWSLAPDMINIVWRESGGPQITAPPRKGFGTRLIEQNAKRMSGDFVTFDWNPDGLVCTVGINRKASLMTHDELGSQIAPQFAA